MGFLVWNQIHYAKIQKYDFKIKSWVTRSHFGLLCICFVIQSKPFPLPSTPHYNALQSYHTTILQVFCTMHKGDTNTNTKIQYTNIDKCRQKLTVRPGNSILSKKTNRKTSKIMDNLSANVENTPVFFGRCCPFSVRTFYILANEDNRGQ